jgi:HAD superfamily hydrolase (TIGR01662 family)
MHYMPLRGVLFDLDDTLFDHDHATGCALAVLRREEPAFAAWAADEFARRHGEVLEALHGEVLAGQRSIDEAREERFRRLLEDAAARPAPRGRALAVAARYREAYKDGWRPVPGAHALLAELRDAGLAIAVVTNNLTAEQEEKLRRCQLDVMVDALITSEHAGAAKPDVRIFTAALERLRVGADQVVMVGDAWHTDIAGAIAAGIRPVWFNRIAAVPPDPGVAELTSLEPTPHAVEVIRGRGPAVSC